MVILMMFAGAYQGKRVLVTGHTGFKGSWMTSWLVRMGAEVCGYSDGVPTKPSLFEDACLASLIRHEIGDVRDAERVRQLILDFRPDFVFHLAAQAIVSNSYSDPLHTIGVNVMGTACVLNSLREVTWPCVAVIITSDKAYFNVEWLWGYRENDRLGGKDVYSASKGAAEVIFSSYWYSYFSKTECPVRLATARAGNVIGGGDWAPDRIVADCVRAWKAKQSVQIRSPRATRPWQHVLEPLSGYLQLGARLVADDRFNGESYNFGPKAEQNATVVELLSDLAGIWGFESSDDAYVVTNDIPFHEAGLLKLNIDKAMAELKWMPTLNYEECVDFTGSWYRDVVKNGGSASEITARDIAFYENKAGERGCVWAK
ncbi:CDP-glucose 4,6-dehydratase [Nitrospirillum sp. BR 11163]|uniref:CDP-glucose 4,6-dehydratase n=1 Tax=Nitrospirillum sp. BR 11163 TaxID=3104323 RepID=UPI002AFEB451|nr:CDP-glucose 4,6-dehydratase [Nitrospirillum sp. BR 11163]MEA1673529.1 CDP-glucose 4,6-dehydratase [Nitrospirillum sp. BR 11163]